MLSERLKKRLSPDRPTTSITLRIPVDVVESMKTIAARKGMGYQTLLKSYIGEGLRVDEARYAEPQTAKLLRALKRKGVDPRVLAEAAKEAA
ncbi:MAG: CopG family antitoxin [Betaproteobacteria bacterium]